MGRPIKKKFFGNLNAGSSSTTSDDKIGGEGVTSSITVGSTGSNYSLGSVALFSSPQIPTGVLATGNLTISAPGAGGITAVTLTEGGSGYTSTATISITTASSTSKASTGTIASTTIYPATTSGIYVGMTVLGTGVGASAKVVTVGAGSVTVSVANANTFSGTLSFIDAGSGFSAITALTGTQQNAINVTAYLLAKDGGVSAKVADIVKQEASHRYLVRTSDGIGQCMLVASNSPSAGQMYIVATDQYGSTYWVTKLTARRAILTQRSMGSQYEFLTNARAGWTLNSASAGVVSISNA